MKATRLVNWIVGAVFVVLAVDAYGLWSVNRALAMANLVLAGLILVFSVVGGYRTKQS